MCEGDGDLWNNVPGDRGASSRLAETFTWLSDLLDGHMGLGPSWLETLCDAPTQQGLLGNFRYKFQCGRSGLLGFLYASSSVKVAWLHNHWYCLASTVGMGNIPSVHEVGNRRRFR
jgi:hypothetical protein